MWSLLVISAIGRQLTLPQELLEREYKRVLEGDIVSAIGEKSGSPGVLGVLTRHSPSCISSCSQRCLIDFEPRFLKLSYTSTETGDRLTPGTVAIVPW